MDEEEDDDAADARGVARFEDAGAPLADKRSDNTDLGGLPPIEGEGADDAADAAGALGVAGENESGRLPLTEAAFDEDDDDGVAETGDDNGGALGTEVVLLVGELLRPIGGEET